MSQIGYLVLKSLWCTCLTKHHSTAMESFLLPGASRCRLCAAVRMACAYDFSYVLSLTHYPSLPRLRQTKLFGIQALWHCLSIPGMPRPLEALNSIVSAVPFPPPKQELHGWNPSSPHSHCWRVPGVSRNRLATVKKAHFVAGLYGGATLRFYGAAVGPRGRTSCV